MEPVLSSNPIVLPMRYVRCPVCDTEQIAVNDDYLALLSCVKCKTPFRYLDGYILLFRGRARQFIDPSLTLPLVPGYTMGSELFVEPNEIYQISFSPPYGKPPEVLFLTGGAGAPDLLKENLYVTAISIKANDFLLLTRVFDRNLPATGMNVRWMSIGELKQSAEKPLWLTYLENSVDLIRKEEDRAAVVILLIALDFFYDEQLAQLGIGYDVVRSAGRRPGMNEKKAKLDLLQSSIGEFPDELRDRLRDVTDYRNRIVHPVVRRNQVPEVPSDEAFLTILETIQWVLEQRYRVSPKEEK